MENKITGVIKLLALADDEKEKSFSIFDENDNNMCAKGKPKVTEREGANIRQCITSPWKNPVRIKVGEFNYLCVKVSNILLGKGNFNVSESSKGSQNHVEIDVKKALDGSKTESKKSSEMLDLERTLTATVVDDLTIILIGRTVVGESLLEQMKEAAKMLSKTSSQEVI